MIRFPDYSKATNAAYETIIEYKAFSFPISPYKILNKMKRVNLYTYEQLKHRFHFTEYPFSSDHGLTIVDLKNNKRIVAYDSNKNYTTIRFTLAHELGHAVLNHIEDGDIENKEANCFARNLLCPVPAIEEMDLQSVSDYQDFFDVSAPMAELSKIYLKNDKYYITEENYLGFNSGVFHKVTGYYPEQFYYLSSDFFTKPVRTKSYINNNEFLF